jgi:hypothetical protein
VRPAAGGCSVTAAAGRVRIEVWQVARQLLAERFVPVLELLGLRAHQRRTELLGELAAGLAVEVAQAEASLLLSVRSDRHRDLGARDPQGHPRARPGGPRARAAVGPGAVARRDGGASGGQEARRRPAPGARPGHPPSRGRPGRGGVPLVRGTLCEAWSGMARPGSKVSAPDW